MPSPSVGLPFDWHLPPQGPSGHSWAKSAAEAQAPSLHAQQLATYSPYADVYERWQQGQPLDWAVAKTGPEPGMCVALPPGCAPCSGLLGLRAWALPCLPAAHCAVVCWG